MKDYIPKPIERFIDRIGKTVYRNHHCSCQGCIHNDSVGIKIFNEDHAYYLETVDREFASDGVYLHYRDNL